MSKDGQRNAARILALVTIVFWLWFGIGSALGEDGGWFNWLMHMLIPGGIFILSGLIAWRWQRVGGILFLLEGLVAIGVLVVVSLGGQLAASTIFLMLLTLALPPLMTGVLFLIALERQSCISQNEM